MAKRLLLIALFLPAGLTQSAMTARRAQEQESTVFRIQVDMVLLNVAVTDSKGNYVTGLLPPDFEIYEDGILQKIATFAEGNQAPRRLSEEIVANGSPRVVQQFSIQNKNQPHLIPPEAHGESAKLVTGANVFILFDTSNWMYRGFPHAQDAITDFVRLLDLPDRVAFYSFSRNVKRLAPLSADRMEVLRAVRKTVAGDDVALYNALLVTLRDAALIPGRKMVVVFSNGPDNASMISPENVRELAQAEGIPIYMISTREAKNDPISATVIGRISDSTGGKAYFAKTWQEQQRTFIAIREDLAHLYALSYYPEPNPNVGWRRITVKLVGDRLKKYQTRTRVGYRPKITRLNGAIPPASLSN